MIDHDSDGDDDKEGEEGHEVGGRISIHKLCIYICMHGERQ